ncbi:MAG: DUF4271 domain-containing protein [Bacteroidota bacterium]
MLFNQSDTIAQVFLSDTMDADTLPVNVTDSLSVSPKTYQSLFVSNTTSGDLTEKPLPVQNQAFWVPLILILGFVLLAWSRLYFKRRLGMIFQGVFARNYANQLIREGNLFNERIGLVLFLLYLSTMAMFAYLAIPLFNIRINMPPGLIYISIFAFFLGLWLLKVFMVRILSLLFSTQDHSQSLLTNMYMYNLFAGIILLPAVSCMAFADLEIFFYISLGLIVFTYSLRLIRGVIIGISLIKFSPFHLMLYLCTLEILPLIVLAKILTRNMIL